MKKLFYICASLFILGSLQAQEITDKSTGISFPAKITVEENGQDVTLQATGVSTRKKFFVKIYSVVSYVQEGSGLNAGNAFSKILEPGYMKQINSKWVRSVEADKIKEGYHDSFRKVLQNGNDQLNQMVEKYISFFGPVKKGDEHVINWLSDNTIVVMINGQERGRLQSEEFAKALWSIWFGKSSVVNRDALISNLK